MSRLYRDYIISPLGYDTATEPALLKDGLCQNLVNLLNGWPGELRGQIGMVNLFGPASAQILGVGWYYAQDIGSIQQGKAPTHPPYLLVALAPTFGEVGGLVYLQLVNTWPPLNQGGGSLPFYDSATIFPGSTRVRFASFGDDVVIVQSGAPTISGSNLASPTNQSPNKRLRMVAGIGMKIDDLGIPQPPPVFVQQNPNPPAGGIQKGTGLVGYVQTFVDERGRESSPSEPVYVLLGNAPAGSVVLPPSYIAIAPGYDVNVTLLNLNTLALGSQANAGQVIAGNLYATQMNGSVYYQVQPNASGYTAIAQFGAADPVIEENTSDATLAGSQVAPNPGENDPPLPASLAVVHGQRLYMDVLGSPGMLQISNENSCSQFASVTLQPTDGVSLRFDTDFNNPITGMVSYRSYLAILCRRGTYLLDGTDPTSFEARFQDARGCIAPDSVAQQDNYIYFLGDDGIYRAHIMWRFEIERLSLPIEPDLQAYMRLPEGRRAMEAAVGWFVDNAYHLALPDVNHNGVLAIPGTIFRYDLNVAASLPGAGWTKIQAGSVTCATVVQQLSFPGFAVVGRNDANVVSIVDTLSTAQSVNGMIYRTRLVQPDMRDEASRGQETRDVRKRPKRVVVFGEGQILSGSLTLTSDGRAKTYSVGPNSGRPWEGALIYQEADPDCWGRAIDVTLNLNGTGITIRGIEVQEVTIG